MSRKNTDSGRHLSSQEDDMKKTAVVYTLCMVAFLACGRHHARIEMPLPDYDYIRTAYNSTDLEFIMGNAEMGGLADIRGLGFEKLWFTDVWENPEARRAVPGPMLSCSAYSDSGLRNGTFRTMLQIKNGILSTEAALNSETAYSTEIFFSHTRRHLLVMRVENRGTAPLAWNLSLPEQGFSAAFPDKNTVTGTDKAAKPFTEVSWALKTSLPFARHNQGVSFLLKPGESQVLKYAVVSSFDSAGNGAALHTVSGKKKFAEMLNEQKRAWEAAWHSIGSIILPRGQYAKWFYRSLYQIYATAGAVHFTGGELQFAVPDADWKMHPFTYGHGGGWPVWVFARLGDRERAENMIRTIYKPGALKRNVHNLYPRTGPVPMTYRGKDMGYHTYLDEYNPGAMAFGHEFDIYGNNISFAHSDKHWDLQRHIDGFAAAFFHKFDRLFADSSFTRQYAYPVLRGTAEMWRSLAKWDTTHQRFYLPPMLSLSENIMEKSVLDAVLAARWNLHTAYRYAERLNLDQGLREQWLNIYNNLYVPANDRMYLEYLGDTQSRRGGGYFGIRAFAYLGFPLLEEIKYIDMDKARISLDYAWERNSKGRGMITFISNWFALTEAYLGNGNRAWDISRQTCSVLDPSGTAMCEAFSYDSKGNARCINPYFSTGADAFALVPMAMMMQSYDNRIRLFPAMPDSIQNAAFFDMQAEHGIRVSAELKNGSLAWAEFKKDDRVLLRTSTASAAVVETSGGSVTVHPVSEGD